MRHDYRLEAFGFTLRPVDDEDAAWIVVLRNSAKARFLHRGAQTEAQQRAWLKDYYERAGDYTFVIESAGRREGMIALYDHDPVAGTALWGRWILVDGSLAAPASAWLILHFAFEVLTCSEVCSQTIAENQSVVAFHDRYARRKTILPDYFTLDEQRYDAIEHAVLRAEWPEVSSFLGRFARMVESKLR